MLHERTRTLADRPNFATLTTLMADGSAQTHVMWIDHAGDRLLINTELHRQKAKNVQRDPRVTVTVIDREDPYRFVEVRGRVANLIRGPRARDHIDQLSMKYFGKPYSNPIQSERVILEIIPDREIVR